jgi:stringent starvation protein B
VNTVSTKPYLVRAIYEWCSDCGHTPYVSVKVDENTKVPQEFVKNGEIVLNVSQAATRNLTISNDRIQFSARFSGASREVSVPIEAVTAIFARENGQGMMFPAPSTEDLDEGASVDAPSDAALTSPPKAVGSPKSAPSSAPPGKPVHPGPGRPPAPPGGRKANLKIVK